MHKKTLLIFIIPLFLILIIFYRNIFRGSILFPANYLVSFFSPWNTMTFPGWEQGIPHKPIGLDNLNLFYPYKDLSVNLVKNGIMPLWNPYNFSGNILMGNFQSAVFYPLNIIYFLLPMADAWSWMVIIQPLLAFIFTYLLLDTYKLGKISSAFGALTFAFCGEMIVWMGDHLVVSHTMIWLPLILYGMEKFLISRKAGYYGIMVFGITFSFFAGFFQPFAYVVGTAILYVLFRLWTNRGLISLKENILLLLAFPLSLGLGAIQLLPSFEALLLSPRNTVDVGYLYDGFLMPIGHLLSFLAPDFRGNPGAYNYFDIGAYHESVLYIGIIPIIFSFYSLNFLKKQKPVIFFGLLSLVSLLLGLNLPFVRWFYELKIPIFYTFLPSRIFFLTSFSLSLLSAFGLNLWLENKKSKPLIRLSFIIVIVLSSFLAYAYFLNHGGHDSDFINQLLFVKGKIFDNDRPVFYKNLILPFVFSLTALALFIISAFKISTKYIIITIFLLTLAGQFYFSQKYLFFSNREFVYPNHPVFDFLKHDAGLNRFWTYGEGYINANFATYYRLYSPDGTDALFSGRLGELYYSAENKGKYTAGIPRIDVRFPLAEEGEDISKNKYRLRLMSIAGIKYVTDWVKIPENKEDQDKKFPPEIFNLVWKKDGWKIFEYKNSLSRIYLTGNYETRKNQQDILDGIYSQDLHSPAVILEETPNIKIEPDNKITTPKIYEYSPNFIKIKSSEKSNRILFLSDTYYPGWKAFIDGKETKIYRANYSFRAVAVPGGKHEVSFSYQPESFTYGIYTSLISLIILFALIILSHRITLRE